jgi:predicted phage gp36 major capsid-like protein
MALRDQIRELREQNKRDADAAGAIATATFDPATKVQRSMTGEEREQFERIHAAIEDRNKTITALERQLDVETGQARPDPTIAAGRQAPDDDGEDDEPPLKAAEDRSKPESWFTTWCRGGYRSLSPTQRAQMRRLPEQEQRAMSALSPTAGGYLAPDELTTSHGNPISFVTDDDTTQEGEIVGESIAVSEGQPTFGQIVLYAYKFSSKLVLVPIEALTDLAIDVDAYLSRKFAMRLGRGTNRKFTVGSGSSEPTGIVTAATVGKTAAATGAVTHAELLDLKHSVDPDYRALPSVRWMFNDSTLLAMKKLVDGFGRPLWQSGIAIKEPNTIDGDSYEINQHMASMAASSKPILYGALESYMIRDVSGLGVVRLVERYAEYGQVGFLAFERHDGNLLDPGTNPVKILQMHA